MRPVCRCWRRGRWWTACPRPMSAAASSATARSPRLRHSSSRFARGEQPLRSYRCNLVIRGGNEASEVEMSGRMHRGWHGRGGRGPGRGGWQQADLPAADDAAAWLAGRLPDGWFTEAPDVTVDREEIVIVGMLPPVEGEFAEGDPGGAERAA